MCGWRTVEGDCPDRTCLSHDKEVQEHVKAEIEATRQLYSAEQESLRDDVKRLIAMLEHVRTFIGYARYELEPGEAELGDQFPRQGCADKIIAKIDVSVRGGVEV